MRRPSFLYLTIPSLIFLVFSATNLWAAPGDVDTTFGEGGHVTTSFDCAGGAIIWSLAFTPDHKIVAAGQCDQHGHLDVAIARYYPNGNLDTSFNGDGTLIADFSGAAMAEPTSESADKVLVQPDGKIIVGGNQVTGLSKTSLLLARYNPDGSPDASFGSNGRVLTRLGGGVSIKTLLLQPDGKFVVVGGVTFSPRGQLAMLRYQSDGKLDPSFGFLGLVVSSPRDFSSTARTMDAVLQPDGKIVVLGNTSDPSDDTMMVMRYLPNGALDESFDGDGIAMLHDIPWSGGSIALQNDGQILVATKETVIRLSSDGAVDASFGDEGIAEVNVVPWRNIQDMAVLPSGKTIVAGFSDKHAFIARLTSDGILDPTFKGVGWVRTQIPGTSFTTASAMLLQRDGKVITAGFSNLSFNSDVYDFAFSLTRYQGDSLELQQDFRKLTPSQNHLIQGRFRNFTIPQWDEDEE